MPKKRSRSAPKDAAALPPFVERNTSWGYPVQIQDMFAPSALPRPVTVRLQDERGAVRLFADMWGERKFYPPKGGSVEQCELDTTANTACVVLNFEALHLAPRRFKDQEQLRVLEELMRDYRAAARGSATPLPALEWFERVAPEHLHPNLESHRCDVRDCTLIRLWERKDQARALERAVGLPDKSLGTRTFTRLCAGRQFERTCDLVRAYESRQSAPKHAILRHD